MRRDREFVRNPAVQVIGWAGPAVQVGTGLSKRSRRADDETGRLETLGQRERDTLPTQSKVVFLVNQPAEQVSQVCVSAGRGVHAKDLWPSCFNHVIRSTVQVGRSPY